MEINQRLKELRLAHQLTQEELAQQILRQLSNHLHWEMAKANRILKI